MMRMGGLIVFAAIAALLGAPSIAFGAETHRGTPITSPAAGTTETLGLVLILGLAGVAAIAIIGTALLAIGRRGGKGPGSTRAADRMVETLDTDSLLQRRLIRRAKVRLEDDPIVTAMGVDDHVEARRRRGTAGPPAVDPRGRPPRVRR